MSWRFLKWRSGGNLVVCQVCGGGGAVFCGDGGSGRSSGEEGCRVLKEVEEKKCSQEKVLREKLKKHEYLKKEILKETETAIQNIEEQAAKQKKLSQEVLGRFPDCFYDTQND